VIPDHARAQPVVHSFGRLSEPVSLLPVSNQLEQRRLQCRVEVTPARVDSVDVVRRVRHERAGCDVTVPVDVEVPPPPRPADMHPQEVGPLFQKSARNTLCSRTSRCMRLSIATRPSGNTIRSTVCPRPTGMYWNNQPWTAPCSSKQKPAKSSLEITSQLSLVDVTNTPKGTPCFRRMSKAAGTFLWVPFPRLASVSFSKPSTETAGLMLPSSAIRRAVLSFINVPFA